MTETTTQPNRTAEQRADDGPQGAGAWLDAHGDALYRYARRRVGRRDVAEDLVQETFLAAIKSPGSFRGDASVRTWLISILRRKIVDHHRRIAAARAHCDEKWSDAAQEFFTADGAFPAAVANWPTPPEIVEDREFWNVLDACLAKMPKTLACAFVLRELEHLETAQLREKLGLSAGNLRVRLFRARQLLRECLEQRWFHPRD